MNLPNKLTILRMIMIPFFLVALMVPGIPGGKWIALALFCLASLTDIRTLASSWIHLQINCLSVQP